MNKFSIENGLGDIDGFVSLANSKNNNFSFDQLNSNNLNSNNLSFDQLNSNNLNSNNFSNLNNKYETNAGQRYKNQFALLEKYEAQYADLSSRLKPESKYMIDLKLKIDNLRGSLKRPNEILIRYKELVRISTRDENLLNNIDEQLVKTNLEIKRQLDPWELISNPTVDNVKVSPKTLQSAIKTFLLSSFFSIIFVFFKEKKSGIIFDFDTLKELINCQYLETISNKNKLLSIKLFDTVIKRITFSETANKNNKTSIIDLTYKENQFKENFKEIKKYGSYDFVKITDQEMIEESEKIVFICTTNQITKNDIRLINKYIVIYSSKLLGWFYLDETSGL